MNIMARSKRLERSRDARAGGRGCPLVPCPRRGWEVRVVEIEAVEAARTEVPP